MAEVKFEFSVQVEEVPDDATDDQIVDEAREILYSAPAFDGLSVHFINSLDVAEIVANEIQTNE